MNTDKQRIYNGDWKTLHPYSGSAPTDLYYITLANKVLAAIRAVETSLEESDYRKIDETEYNPQNEMFQRFKTKCSFLQNEAYLCKSFFLP